VRALRITTIAVLLSTAAGVAGAASPHATAASEFCSRFSLVTIGSIEGQKVTLAETTAKGHTIGCVYDGTLGSSIETESDLPASSTSSLKGAEALAKANFPSAVLLKFAAVPKVGATAFDWSAKDGSYIYSGLNTNKGATGYFVELSGSLQLPKLEKLLALEIRDK
jgi:hypothetical protein